jgi:hypothetical protein
MVDDLNHLARMYILSQSGAANANPYYEAAWALYPNLAMDLMVPQIARLVSVENAMRLFLLSSQLLIIGGAVALERVVKGRVEFAGFAAVMFLYCLPFAWGFVNRGKRTSRKRLPAAVTEVTGLITSSMQWDLPRERGR